jgi:hypothetical protein
VSRIGPYEVSGPAPAPDGLTRRRAVDTRTGEPVELVALRTPAAESEATRRRFANTHRSLTHARNESLTTTYEVLSGEHVVAVRSALLDETMADIAGPLPADAVAAIGHRLAPAVLSLGGAHNGALTAHDVGLDARGRPVLAPWARPPGLTDQAWAAPECFQGQHPDGNAGLYGLGATLYQLATGQAPTGRPPARPSALNRTIPNELDKAILSLLANDPTKRQAALPILASLAASDVDLTTALHRSEAMPDNRHLSTGQVLYTTGTPKTPNSDSRLAHIAADKPRAGAVLVPPDVMSSLDPALLSRIAGWAGVPVDSIRELAERGLPAVLETPPSKRAVAAQAETLSRTTNLSLTTATPGGWLLLLGALVLFSGAAAALLTAIPIGVFFTPLAALVPVAMALLIALPGLWLIAAFIRRRAAWNDALEGWEELASVRRAWAKRGLGDSLDRIASLRKRLGATSLPAAADADLRDALRSIEHRLVSLSEVMDTADQALAQVDLAAVKGRLAALEGQIANQPQKKNLRDRLARTVADAQAIVDRRAKLSVEVEQIHDALDEVATVLVQLADDGHNEGALDALIGTTRLVHEAVGGADEEARKLAAMKVST